MSGLSKQSEKPYDTSALIYTNHVIFARVFYSLPSRNSSFSNYVMNLTERFLFSIVSLGPHDKARSAEKSFWNWNTVKDSITLLHFGPYCPNCSYIYRVYCVSLYFAEFPYLKIFSETAVGLDSSPIWLGNLLLNMNLHDVLCSFQCSV